MPLFWDVVCSLFSVVTLGLPIDVVTCYYLNYCVGLHGDQYSII